MSLALKKKDWHHLVSFKKARELAVKNLVKEEDVKLAFVGAALVFTALGVHVSPLEVIGGYGN